METKHEEVPKENQINSQSNQSENDQTERDRQLPVTVTTPEEVKEPLVSQPPAVDRGSQEDKVHVEPHLPDLVAGIAIPLEEEERAREQRDLDQTIHWLLIVGLAISVSLMLFGLLLDLTLHRVIPTAIPNLRDVFSRLILLRPSGYLSLGLLVLIVTPVVRVLGSFVAFIYERDWRYAGITFLVLLIVTLSIVLGKG